MKAIEIVHQVCEDFCNILSQYLICRGGLCHCLFGVVCQLELLLMLMLRRKKSRMSTVSPLHSQPFFLIYVLMTVQHLRCYHQFPFPLSGELCPSFTLSLFKTPPFCLQPPALAFSQELEAIRQHLHIYLNAGAACFHLPSLGQTKYSLFKDIAPVILFSFLCHQFFIFLPDDSHWHRKMVA